ncbi:MAG: tryptophan synthase subunit alpha [Ilumatobacteraceae bacterium]|jgi:tryptophan synthase alpha chain|nr:tryptophan synthase subunit alpha [Ilumatobacteraceae bacterium]MDP5109224.1 tryptophan synthase subunit alpha [Ilumatobacteraceae bacterium]
MNLESHLRAQRSAGRKLLVPYVTGGLLNWKEAIRVAAACGADAIEVGIPFSDPVMDGPVIQEASLRALKDGATPFGIIQEISTLEIDIPIAVMLYYNTVFRAGHERFATSLVKNGVSAAIVPDLPLEEAGEWCRDADAAGVETIMLAAPTAPDSRLPLVVERARGFVYAVGLLGITGERDSLASTATVLAGRLKNITDKPVLIGVGVSNAEQAYEACKIADGVIQGASVVRRLMESGPDAVGEYITEVRAAIDTP